MRGLTALVTLLVLALAGCGGDEPRGARVFAATETSATGTPTPEVEGYRGPPSIQLVTDGGKTQDAYLSSFCWKSLCADIWGLDAAELPDMGSRDVVDFYFPIPGTYFSATFHRDGGDECLPAYSGVVTDHRDGWYSLEPAGPPDSYRVDLMGHASHGDVPGHFVWTTPVQGPLGEPRAEISVVWKPEGKIEPAHVVLDLRDVARTPRDASAEVTVTAGNGAAMSFDMGRPDVGCPETGYASFWRVDEQVGREAAALGPEPFRYDVELVLNGTTHSASATWPDDHVDNPENDDPAPVPLEFDPPLPSRG